MIFIKTNENKQITYTHNMPFDSVYGLRKTEEQLKKEGYLVDSVPELLDASGQPQTIFYDPVHGFWGEDVIREETVDEKIAKVLEENKALKQQQALMQQALDDLIIGGAV